MDAEKEEIEVRLRCLEIASRVLSGLAATDGSDTAVLSYAKKLERYVLDKQHSGGET